MIGRVEGCKWKGERVEGADAQQHLQPVCRMCACHNCHKGKSSVTLEQLWWRRLPAGLLEPGELWKFMSLSSIQI